MILPLLLASLAAPPREGSLRLTAPMDSAQTAALADSLVGVWQEEGHLLASVRLTALPDRVDFVATPGARFVWRDTRLVGDSAYTPYALDRLSGLVRGQPARPSELEQATQRIESDGCAEVAGIPNLQGQRGTIWADAWLPIRRLPCSQAQALVGWEQNHGYQGFVEAKLGNVLGTARQGALSVSAKTSERRFQLDWREPWLGDWQAGLDLQLELRETTEEQLRRGMTQLRIPAGTGTWLVGLEAWSDLQGLADSTPHTLSAMGSRVGWERTARERGWIGSRWEMHVLATNLQTWGSSEKLLVRAEITALRSWTPLSWLSLQVRGSGKSLWPLDSSLAMSEARSIGGASGWKGHQEGQFLVPRWAWGEFETRLGNAQWGTALFAAPGIQGNERTMHTGWGAGGGIFWSRDGNDLRLDLAAGESTRTWDEAFLHLTARNRF